MEIQNVPLDFDHTMSEEILNRYVFPALSLVASFSRPIRCESETNHAVAIHVFPRFKSTCLRHLLKLSLAPRNVNQ